MKLISKFFFPLFVLSILYLLLSKNLLSPSPLIIAIQVLALALGVWARRTFQAGQFSTHAEVKDGQLLVKGPYQVIRHPIYTTVLTLVWSSVAGHPSLTTVIISVFMTIVTIARISTEEEFLRTHYPAYEEYARKTKRIIPYIF
ncbi:MAG: isoprenylcysteine carboxylmethyltransferase family protein [Anaerolineales bacterium]